MQLRQAPQPNEAKGPEHEEVLVSAGPRWGEGRLPRRGVRERVAGAWPVLRTRRIDETSVGVGTGDGVRDKTGGVATARGLPRVGRRRAVGGPGVAQDLQRPGPVPEAVVPLGVRQELPASRAPGRAVAVGHAQVGGGDALEQRRRGVQRRRRAAGLRSAGAAVCRGRGCVGSRAAPPRKGRGRAVRQGPSQEAPHVVVERGEAQEREQRAQGQPRHGLRVDLQSVREAVVVAGRERAPAGARLRGAAALRVLRGTWGRGGGLHGT